MTRHYELVMRAKEAQTTEVWVEWGYDKLSLPVALHLVERIEAMVKELDEMVQPVSDHHIEEAEKAVKKVVDEFTAPQKRGPGRSRSVWTAEEIKWMIKHKDIRPQAAYTKFKAAFSQILIPPTEKQFTNAFYKHRNRDPDTLTPDSPSLTHSAKMPAPDWKASEDVVIDEHPESRKGVDEEHTSPFSIGDKVRLKQPQRPNHEGIGIVVKIKGNQVLLGFGIFKLWVHEDAVVSA